MTTFPKTLLRYVTPNLWEANTNEPFPSYVKTEDELCEVVLVMCSKQTENKFLCNFLLIAGRLTQENPTCKAKYGIITTEALREFTCSEKPNTAKISEIITLALAKQRGETVSSLAPISKVGLPAKSVIRPLDADDDDQPPIPLPSKPLGQPVINSPIESPKPPQQNATKNTIKTQPAAQSKSTQKIPALKSQINSTKSSTVPEPRLIAATQLRQEISAPLVQPNQIQQDSATEAQLTLDNASATQKAPAAAGSGQSWLAQLCSEIIACFTRLWAFICALFCRRGSQ